MTEIMCIVAAVCAALSLIVSLLVLKNQKRTPLAGGKTEDTGLLQQLDRANYIAEQNAKNTQNYLNYLGQQQGEKLQGVQDKLEALNSATERRLAEIQRVVSGEIRYMAEQNAKNLEQIRETVDEKLSSTLENRLNKSYSIINERLEAVYKGIGEVQQLAGSVADIKKVFANVKLRGTWGEVQLSALLDQMLSPTQYRANVRINPMDNAVVEYAVLLPSRDGETVYLPIDSKFPVEEYRRLLDASDACDKDASDRALKNLERALKLQADTIAKKYILPPLTADFAIMFLPLEGLYAETLKMPGLSEYLASKRVMACGPTNLGALLTTLQIGFKTAAIERRSGELWELLSAFRHEFRNFVQILEKAQKKLQEAQDTIENAAKKTRTIDKKLKNVSEITDERANLLLGNDPDDGE
ncbi:MAG TPA: DNA recombination protein RmuC [Candidatus Borkfalkia faecipullorum]|uniref:DNA recombination protein RmuC n=1 Tax=Candidatus Borkfalkia faecipullorum TaxID=2838510 RepID=A0A9D1V7L5_9FIRM|nr:DNA recombination protein RmuC [Candidatus Borkfalkia faecipullorum]